MFFDTSFINSLLDRAKESPRLRQHYDLRNSAADTSQRMLNALLPGTEVAIHRHEETAETVVCLMGKAISNWSMLAIGDRKIGILRNSFMIVAMLF